MSVLPAEMPITGHLLIDIIRLEGTHVLPDMAILDRMSGRRQRANSKLASRGRACLEIDAFCSVKWSVLLSSRQTKGKEVVHFK